MIIIVIIIITIIILIVIIIIIIIIITDINSSPKPNSSKIFGNEEISLAKYLVQDIGTDSIKIQ